MGRKVMKELEKVRRYIYNCRKCGVCVSKVTGGVPYVCPVKESTAGFDHFSSRGKTIIAQGLLEGEIEPSQELAEVIFSCTLCGNCMTQCGSINQDTGEALVDTNKIVEAMRADFLENHPEWIDPAYESVLHSTRQYNNPWGLPRTAKEKWAKKMKLKNARKEPAPVLLFIGCTMASSQELSPRARKAAEIMGKASVDFAILGKDEPCCGSVQKRIGDLELASEMMEENVNLFNSLGCETIVTLCAGCANMLKNDYRETKEKLKPRVLHIVEFLPKLITEEKLQLVSKNSLKVSYHDPCHLGRHMGVYDEPRAILDALPGVDVIERPATKENTICCGAGGGMRIFASGSLAEKIGQTTVQSAIEVGAEALVTACPFCEMNLEAAARNPKNQIPVYDIIDLVYEALK
ncbi:MAG: (Fe-S)-binding protein [Deltaproteobacteria bacterium]|nr:(Fe-S)-binding protein [Deltaproteobacteria bacterium]